MKTSSDANEICLMGTVIGRFWKVVTDCPRPESGPIKQTLLPRRLFTYTLLLEPTLCRRARYDPCALLYLWGTNFCISYSSNCRIRISSYSQESKASQHSSTFCRRAKPEAALQTGSMFNIHRSWEALGKDKVKCQRVMNAPNRTTQRCGISGNLYLKLYGVWPVKMQKCKNGLKLMDQWNCTHEPCESGRNIAWSII